MSKKKAKLEDFHRRSIVRLNVLRAIRLIVQISFLVVANLALSIAFPLPIIGLSYPWTSFPSALDMLQIMIILLVPPLLPLASIVFFNVILGRIFCGWLCPFGFVQDLAAYLFNAKRFISSRIDHNLKFFKYIVLIIVLLTCLAFANLTITNTLDLFAQNYGRGIAIMPFTAIAPDATLFGTIPLLFSLGILPNADKLLSSLNTALFIRYFILVIVLVLAARISRFWCRYVCPMGSLNAIFSSKSILGIYRSVGKCDECGLCNKICPVQIDVINAKIGRIDSKECIMCFECVAACHTDAISITFKKR
ncbi:MAG: 4Fe-4S binding protein [Thermoproteota archaeon]|jgi:polyferredoxin|nr:4Fe-4S binding protein [Thermoproteota archaeon]